MTWFRAEGWSLGDMVQAWHVNAASSGLVWDLTIAATALSLWIVAEVIRNRKIFPFDRHCSHLWHWGELRLAALPLSAQRARTRQRGPAEAQE